MIVIELNGTSSLDIDNASVPQLIEFHGFVQVEIQDLLTETGFFRDAVGCSF